MVKLKDVFKSNSFPENFINNCFKTFLDNKHRIQEKLITVPKKPLFLVLPYLGPLSLQTRTKVRKSLKGNLNCCTLQVVLQSYNKLANACFEDCIPKKITSGVVYKFLCGLCNESYYDECARHLNVQDIFWNFGVLSKENRKSILELKESLLIMRDKPSLNRNIRSAPL